MNNIDVSHTNLVRHPRNIHQKYPLAEVRRMALSQVARERRGLEPCVQPIIITLGPGKKFNSKMHDPLHTTFTIVAGHKRHAGNAWLKDKAPLLNCIVRNYASENDMLAEMSTENGVRSESSPLEWAYHFKLRLDSDPALDHRHLARETGKSVYFVRQHLDMLQLTPTAQKLIDQRKLQFQALPLLLRLTDPKVQAKAAKTFADHRYGLKTISKRVDALLSIRPKPQPGKPRARPARPSTDGLPDNVQATLNDLRASARAACTNCDLRPAQLAEPAWTIALRVSGHTCDDCGLQDTELACSGCPLADMMSGVVASLSGGDNGRGNGRGRPTPPLVHEGVCLPALPTYR